jgi:Spy/CpxP family protein refolding chaperone
MKKLALFPFLVLSVAFISLADTNLAEKHDLKAQVLAQSTREEPQSPEDFIVSLELTEEQKSQIETILNKYRPEIKTTFQKRQAALEELNNVVKPNSSNKEILVARDNFVDLNRKLSDTLFEELMAVRDVLTVEQRERIREQINQRINELASASQTAP